jgi:hypothetical protein
LGFGKELQSLVLTKNIVATVSSDSGIRRCPMTVHFHWGGDRINYFVNVALSNFCAESSFEPGMRTERGAVFLAVMEE